MRRGKLHEDGTVATIYPSVGPRWQPWKSDMATTACISGNHKAQKLSVKDVRWCWMRVPARSDDTNSLGSLSKRDSV